MLKLHLLSFLFAFLLSSLLVQAQSHILSDMLPTDAIQFPSTLQENIDIRPKTIILKVKPAYRSFCQNNAVQVQALQPILSRLLPIEIHKLYPHHTPPERPFNSYGQALTDLSLIYQLSYQADIPVLTVVNQINASGVVLYAQPAFIAQPLHDNQVLFTPNDTSISLQWYLNKIGCFQVWDSTQGDTNVVIGIVDGGTNFTHPDLVTNVYYNYADPIDGIDNDNDGYIDNFRGWDVGDNDNNPQYIGAFNSAHGTSMCGNAAASTNNITGMAGVGYNCRYMPVKIVNASQGWIAGYQGIVYAADHGADIISCSWGSNTPEPYGQDVIRYATINKQKIILAAAGNSNNTLPFYPASYEYVIGVAATQQTDLKSSNSSYYTFVDISAPGQAIFNTYANGWGMGNGTSDATSIAAGGTALVMSYHNNLNAWQAGALIQQTAYSLDTIPGNAPYAKQLGSGRLDLWRAISQPQRAFIHMTERQYTNHHDNFFLIGDTVWLSGNYLNILANSTSNLKAKLISQNPYVTIIDSIVSIGQCNALQNASPTDSFAFIVNPACPVNYSALFKIDYDDNGFTNHQFIYVFINPEFYTSSNHGLVTTLTSTGRIGFNDNASAEGSGYRIKDKPNQLLQLYFNPMGFWIGAANKVSNQTLSSPMGPCCPFNNDNHFVNVNPLYRITPPLLAQTEYKRSYTDANAGADQHHIRITQTDYFNSNTYYDSLRILIRYEIQNQDSIGKNHLFSGIFSDFDVLDTIFDFTPNKAYYDTSRQLGVVYNPIGNTWCGVQLLSQKQVAYYANNSNGSNGSINIYNGITQTEKWTMISSGIARPVSDLTDVTQFIGCRIDSLPPQACDVVWFALLIAPSQSELLSLASDTWIMYQSRFNTWTGSMDSNWHNPLNWSKGQVPDNTDHVIIPWVPGYAPEVSSTDAVAKNIEILCGGTLHVTNNRKVLIGN